jgi:hypothetical protein
MRSLRHKAALAVVSFCFMTGFAVSSVAAQDASPEASGECVVTTPEENIALAENLIAALEAGDAETIDTILADDLVSTVDRYGLEHDATTNDDEIALAAMQEQVYPGSVTTINDAFATETRVTVDQTLTITEHLLTGESIVLDAPLEVDQIIIFTVECGEIVHMHGIVDEYELFVGLGLIAPIGGEEATPAP